MESFQQYIQYIQTFTFLTEEIRSIIIQQTYELFNYYLIYAHPFYNVLQNTFDLVIDFVNKDNYKQLTIHITNELIEYKLLEDTGDFHRFQFNELYSAVLTILPFLPDKIKVAEEQLRNRQITSDTFISFCEENNVNIKDYPKFDELIKDAEFNETYLHYKEMVRIGKKKKEEVLQWMKQEKREYPSYIEEIQSIVVERRKPQHLQDLAKDLKEKKITIEAFKKQCQHSRFPPEEFEEYNEVVFEDNWNRKKKLITRGKITHHDAENWLIENKRNTDKYMKELKQIVVEKKGKSLLEDVRKTLLDDDEELKNSDTIISIDRAVKKCQISRSDGFRFIENEIDIIHESVNVAISLFISGVISLKEVEKCLTENGCLTNKNIIKLKDGHIRQYPDMAILEKWKRDKKIPQDTFNLFAPK